MIRRIVVLSVSLVLVTAVSMETAVAQGRGNNRNDPQISGVFVNHGSPGESRIIIRGENLQGRAGRDETAVLIGLEGPLELLDGSTENELVVRCFVEDTGFDCEKGDYTLTVPIVDTEDEGATRASMVRRVTV